MNGRRGPAPAFVAYVALAFLPAPAALAQTGAAGTRQMQDTQRKAHQKARDAKKDTHHDADTQNEKKAKPASDAQ